VLGVAVLLAGGLVGAGFDRVLQVTGREDPGRTLAVAVGLVIAVAWLVFAAVAGNGYGPDER
jgi:hypothetical protein